MNTFLPIHCVKGEDDSQKIVHIYDDNRWKRETEIEWTMQILDYFEGDFNDNEEQDKKNNIFCFKENSGKYSNSTDE
jgi:hypothetical protein